MSEEEFQALVELINDMLLVAYSRQANIQNCRSPVIPVEPIIEKARAALVKR